MPRNAETLAWYRQVKQNAKCVVCGFQHPAAIEFHHKDPSKKNYTISEMVKNGMSITEVMEEMNLTIALCSNHHKMIHYEWRQNSLGLDFNG